MTLEVRPATTQDLDAVTALLVAQLREHRVDTGDAALRASVDGVLRHPERGRILVAVEDGRVVGFAALSFVWPLEHGGRSAWLEELYVDPPRRSRGVGTTLLHAAIEAATAAGAVAIDLEVDVDHERVARLYTREGFEPLPRSRFVRKLPGHP
jgi:ribosomal protein S18 acetylase RimI-like enzyme